MVKWEFLNALLEEESTRFNGAEGEGEIKGSKAGEVVSSMFSNADGFLVISMSIILNSLPPPPNYYCQDPPSLLAPPAKLIALIYLYIRILRARE